MSWQDSRKLLKSTFVEFFRENSLMYGAALSYYFMLALVPMLYLSVNYVGMFVGEEEIRSMIGSLLNQWIGLSDPGTVLGFLDQVDFSRSSMLLQIAGILALLFSCSAIFNALRRSLNVFFDIDRPDVDRKKLIIRNLISRLLSMSFVVGASVLVVVLYFAESLFLGVATNVLDERGMLSTWLLMMLDVVLPILSNLIIFWFMFKYMHDGKVSWKLALRGSVLTSLLLFLGQWLIKFYLTNYFFGSHGGVGGTMLVILVWVYYSSQIIFFGAKYIAVYARSKGTPIRHVMAR